nr:MAG TPA: hypothetical protein [Caudoviricetes sp.]
MLSLDNYYITPVLNNCQAFFKFFLLCFYL